MAHEIFSASFRCPLYLLLFRLIARPIAVRSQSLLPNPDSFRSIFEHGHDADPFFRFPARDFI